MTIDCQQQNSKQKRAQRIAGICRAADSLSVSRQHLQAVLTGKRLSKPLLARYRTWKNAPPKIPNRKPPHHETPHSRIFGSRPHHPSAGALAVPKPGDIAVGVMPRVHEQVVLENSLPAGAQLSPDGKVIVSDWPVTPDTLRKLGLPMDASQQEYETYHRAEAVKVTPDIAALLVRELIQFSQITHATTFQEALAFLQKHRPELHILAVKPQHTS